MDLTSAGYTQGLNREAPWDSFDSDSYIDHNYSELRAEDLEIMESVRDFFSEHFRRNPGRPVSAIDVGAGANLYPALTMLPWCKQITLFEHSAMNVRWLKEQVKGYGSNWDQFWEVLRKRQAYRGVQDPRARFRISVVEQGSLFDLPEGLWGMGTMFFVAESISAAYEEFHAGVSAFARSLTRGAPFAAAFMENSHGYEVGGQLFPACPVDEQIVRESLAPHTRAEDLRISRIGLPEGPLREGYTGMLLACGRRS